jgi:hypothetical protein
MADIPEYLKPSQPEAPMVQANAPAVGTVPLMRLEDQSVVHVPINDVDVAVRSGIYVPQRDHDFFVVDDSGDTSSVKGEHLSSVLNNGYKLEDPRATHHREVVSKYGDSALRTFAEGAASSATLGGTDWAARAAGVPEEDLAGREEANPIASTMGQIAGLVPGMLTGGAETSLAMKAVKAAGTPMRAVSGVAELAEKAVAKGLFKQGAKAGLDKTVTKSIIEKMIAGGTGGIVEGAFLGAGQLVHEAALGTADANAENLASYATMGGLIGGAFGASVGGAIAGLGKLGGKAAEVVGEAAGEFSNKEKAAFEILGFSPSQVVKLDKRRPGFRNDLVNFLEKDVGLEALDSTEALHAKITALKEEAGKGIKKIYTQADILADKNPGLRTNLKTLNKQLADEIESEILKKGAISTEAKMQQSGVQKYHDMLIKDSDSVYAGSKNLNFSELQAMKQAADDMAKMNKVPGAKSALEDAATYARRFYASKIESGIKAASELSKNRGLLDAFQKANKIYSMASEVEGKVATKAAKTSHMDPVLSAVFGIGAGALTTHDLDGATLGGVAALAGRKFLMSDIRRNLVVLGKIEKAHIAMNKAMDTAVKSFFNPIAKTAEIAPLKTLLTHELGKTIDGKKPKTMDAAYVNFTNTMNAYQQNPEAFMQRVNKSTHLMQDAAPNTAAALDATAVKGVMFLNSKLPRQKSKPGVLDMLKKPKIPSNFEMAKFHRYLSAVDDPKSVIKDIETGKITHEGVEALATVYPTVYKALQAKVMDKLQTDGDTLTYNKRVQLGSLFHVAADDSMLPENILALQGNFQAQPETDDAGAPVVKPNQKGLQNLGMADRMKTDAKTEV